MAKLVLMIYWILKYFLCLSKIERCKYIPPNKSIVFLHLSECHPYLITEQGGIMQFVCASIRSHPNDNCIGNVCNKRKHTSNANSWDDEREEEKEKGRKKKERERERERNGQEVFCYQTSLTDSFTAENLISWLFPNAHNFDSMFAQIP